MKTARKSNIEFVRFVASICIFLGHASLLDGYSGGIIRPLPKGYIYVELFFMLTGCFCAAHVDHNSIDQTQAMKYSVKYSVKKLYRILPFAICGLILCYVWRFFFFSMSFEETIIILAQTPYELLLLNITGLSNLYLNAPLWYLSTLLLMLPLFMFIMIRFPDLFRSYLSWAFPFCIYGFLITKFESMNCWGNSPIYLVSALRATAGLALGACCHYAGTAIKKWSTGKHEAVAGILEITVFGVAGFLSYTNFSEVAAGRLDMLIVLLFFLALVLSYSGITWTSRVNNRIIDYAGRLSSVIYCIHWGVLVIIQCLFPVIPFKYKLLIASVSCFLLALVLQGSFDFIQKQQRKKKKLGFAC